MSDVNQVKAKSSRVRSHLIVGCILSTILVVACLIFLSSQLMEGGLSIPISLIFIAIIAIPFGAIGYTLIKIWHDWFNKYFVVFTRNPIQLLVFNYIIDPLVGVVGFISLGYYLLYKAGLLNGLLALWEKAWA